MLEGGVNAERGVETVLITALSSSDDKVQALDLAKRTLQLLQRGLLLQGPKRMTSMAMFHSGCGFKKIGFSVCGFLTCGPSLGFFP